MEPTTKTLHFRYHPRFSVGMVLRHRTLITSGVPFRIESEGWLVRSIRLNGDPAFPQANSCEVVLEQQQTEDGK